MINLKSLAEIIANIFGGIAILAVVIFAAVAYLKQLGLKGQALTVSAFVVGVIIAVAVRLAMMLPASPADWIWTFVFGLMGGLLATGAYKGIESATGKIKTGVIQS